MTLINIKINTSLRMSLINKNDLTPLECVHHSINLFSTLILDIKTQINVTTNFHEHTFKLISIPHE